MSGDLRYVSRFLALICHVPIGSDKGEMSSLGSSRFERIVDRQQFEKELTETLHKALHVVEAPPKEKHVRNVIIASWRENSTATLWKLIPNFPNRQLAIVCWKTCYVLHKVFRDGPKKAISSSANKVPFLTDLWKHWGTFIDPYSKLVHTYLRVLITKITFHTRYPEIPGSVNFQEEPFKMPTNVDDTFQLAVELFDLQSSLLHLFGGILTHLDPSKGISAQQVQCRIHPLIACIAESSSLYDLKYKVMNTLHRSLPADVLQGHRDRFNRQYNALRKYYNEVRKMKYFESLVEIPELKENPPNFLLDMQEDAAEPKPLATSISTQSESVQSSSVEAGFTDLEPFDFGTINKEPEVPKRDERDDVIEQLMKEGVQMKEKITSLQTMVRSQQNQIEDLNEKLRETQMELTEYKEIAEHACSENVLLKNQIEELQTERGAQTAAEARASSLDEKYAKLKQVYTKLRDEHIELLRSNGESKKQLTTSLEQLSEESKKLEEAEGMIQQLSLKLDDTKLLADEEHVQVEMYKARLETLKAESAEFQVVSEKLKQHSEDASKMSAHKSLVYVIEAIERDVNGALDQLDREGSGGVTCPPSYLVECSQKSKEMLEKSVTAHNSYVNQKEDIGKVLAALPSASSSSIELFSCSKSVGSLVSEEDSQKLIDAAKLVGKELLAMLMAMKQDNPTNISGNWTSIQAALDGLRQLGLTMGTEDESEDLEVAVDEEMSATEKAVDDAIKKIQDMLEKTKQQDTGKKLEVNSSILTSCTTLMEAMQTLIKSAIALQNEIVSEGRGQSSPEDFYKKHHRWTEGLVSAAKAVGNGATMVVNSADKVVNGKGKFEELIVYSKDIAASTAQLVAASRVKARQRSEKLTALKSASKTVTGATGGVVVTAQSFLDRRKSDNFEHLKNLTLTQAKRAEMECQVRTLELEKEVELERARLAELRKLHYHLAGTEEGWEIEEES